MLRSDLLGVWAAWLTPIFEPHRYRTWFFVAALPSGQVTRDVSSESSSVDSDPGPRVAAEQADAGALALMPPTYLTAWRSASTPSPEEVLAVSAAVALGRDVHAVGGQPLDEGWTLSMPDRLRPLVAAPARERDRLERPAGTASVAECLLAPNPNMMTLDGTNTWVLREPGVSQVVAGRPRADRETGTWAGWSATRSATWAWCC